MQSKVIIYRNDAGHIIIECDTCGDKSVMERDATDILGILAYAKLLHVDSENGI